MLEYSSDIADQPFQWWVLVGSTGEDSDQTRSGESASAETDGFAKATLDPVATSRRPDSFTDKDAIPELLGRPPDKGKKIGRKALPLIEK